jgi:prepilin-type N-terminal cleavage/methylation domain-containing protein
VTRRHGFTLLEVMLAIVLTSLIVLLAYGAAQVSYDAHARLGADLRGLQEVRALRELLRDALRGARAPQRPGDPLFTLQAGRLSFVTAGGGPPLDPDFDWLVAIAPGAEGLELSATPVGRVPAIPVAIRVPAVTRWEVRARAAGATPWLSEWSKTSALPRVVAITLWHDATPVGPPLQVRLVTGAPAGPQGSPPQ